MDNEGGVSLTIHLHKIDPSNDSPEQNFTYQAPFKKWASLIPLVLLIKIVPMTF